jgi:hypothetical protein
MTTVNNIVAQLSKDAAAKVHESSEMEAKIETSSPCFEGPAQKVFINKTDLKAPLLGGDDIAYGDDAIQPDFQHKEAKIEFLRICAYSSAVIVVSLSEPFIFLCFIKLFLFLLDKG